MTKVGYVQQATDFWTALDIQRKNVKGEPHNYNISVLMVQGQIPHDKLKTLNNCNCCVRHGTNKPTCFSPQIECESDSFMNSDQTVHCECNCRHLARLICRNPSVCDECSDF